MSELKILHRVNISTLAADYTSFIIGCSVCKWNVPGHRCFLKSTLFRGKLSSQNSFECDNKGKLWEKWLCNSHLRIFGRSRNSHTQTLPRNLCDLDVWFEMIWWWWCWPTRLNWHCCPRGVLMRMKKTNLGGLGPFFWWLGSDNSCGQTPAHS